MKLFTLTILALGLTITSFASGNRIDIDQKVLTSFTSEFSAASEISWSKSSTYVKASFKLNQQSLFAYYNFSGELIGVSRNISSLQLPLNLQSLIKQKYGASWITDLFEFSTKEQTVYVATLENADEKITIKSTSGQAWEIAARSKKP